MALPPVILQSFQTRSTLIVMKDLSSKVLVEGNARQMERGVEIRHFVKVLDFRCLLLTFLQSKLLSKRKTNTELKTKLLEVFLNDIPRD